MIRPPTPPNEAQRLSTLYSLNVLDTPPEERFDRITRIAQQIFGVPIALVSLVDANRQWFKSKQGLSVSQTPREISFCGHAILGEDCLVVPYALEDPIFRDNPLVTEQPNIRFYAGYPLSGPDGTKMGTLCIMDNQPRWFSLAELQPLLDLGKVVEEELASVALNHALAELNGQRRKLRDSEELFRQIAENVAEVFWTIDLESESMLYINPAYENIWGRKCEDLYKNPRAWIEGIHPEDRERANARFAEALRNRESFEAEYRVVTPSGIVRYIHDRGFPVLDPLGRPYRLVGIATDITERKRAEADLERLAITDGLTGLYNSRYFQERVTQEIAVARRRDSIPSLAMIDLDHFKAINDGFGHSTGDAVLAAVSKAIHARLRAADCAARIGGDEFAILMSDSSEEQTRNVMEVLRHNIEALVVKDSDDPPVRVTCSIGVATLDEQCQDTKSFLNIADRALYQAKAAGRNRVVVHPASGH